MSSQTLHHACIEWERAFVAGHGQTATGLRELAHRLPPQSLADLAITARDELKLRFAPLALVCEMTRFTKRHRALIASTLEKVIQTPNEITEYVTIYWKLSGGRCPLSKQSKLGLKAAFNKFTEQEFANCDDDGEVKLRDVLSLVHAKPKDREHGRIFARIANKTYLPIKTRSGFPVAKVYGSLIQCQRPRKR